MAFAHLTLAVRDVAAASRFFQQTLRWRSIRQPGNIDLTADWLQIGPGQQLHLLEVADFAPSPFEREFGRHFAIFHPAADWQALQDRLLQAGAELIEAIRETPFPRFFFRDPNGYVFEVIDQDAYVIE